MKKILFLFFITFTLSAQEKSSWKLADKTSTFQQADIQKPELPNKVKVYNLETGKLLSQLITSPVKGVQFGKSQTFMTFPDDTGKFTAYEVFETKTMSTELSNRFPLIKTYIGFASNGNKIRFTFDDIGGFKGRIFRKGKEDVRIKKNATGQYEFYSELKVKDAEAFNCEIIEMEPSNMATSKNSILISGDLRKYRIALASNGEYSQIVLSELGISPSSTDLVKKTAILGHLADLVNSMNEVYERDVSVTLELVANNDKLVFLDPSTDGMRNYTSIWLLDEFQPICDSEIGSLNYDLGHVLTTSFGGVAALGSVCNSTLKAKSTSGVAPQGYNPFDLQYTAVMHEVGHQFGATHTFNSCDIATADPMTGVETGAGTTIMAYSNSCLFITTVHSYTDLFFHSVSIDQMRQFVSFQANCSTTISTGNSKPTANAGLDVIVPKSTPIMLEGISTDPDGSVMTYTWEQVNPESTNYPLPSIAPQGPAFKWIPPSTEPVRYLPSMSTILQGQTSNKWEVLPSVSRNLDFIFQVRDNDPSGGETAADSLQIIVDDSAGPFVVTTGNSSEIWYAGTNKMIAWEVANTNQAPINATTVDILFSQDGGQTYPHTFASNVPNSGSYSLAVPFGIITTQGRIMVKANNNIFFDINDVNISLYQKNFLINMVQSETEKSLCLDNATSIQYTFTYNSYLGYAGSVAFTSENAPGNVSFSPENASADGTLVTMTISNLTSSNIGTYEINIIGNSGSEIALKVVDLNITDGNISTVSLVSPSNGQSGQPEPYYFEWINDINISSFQFQIATDNTFSNIVEDSIVISSNYTFEDLDHSTTYYWRVRGINECQIGNYGSIFSFTTQSLHQYDTYVPDDVFEQALVDLGYDSGPLDNYVKTANISSVVSLSLDNMGVSDLTGIEGFAGLTTLSVRNYNTSPKLSSLDLSGNSNLAQVYAPFNDLTSVDVTGCTKLRILGLFDNKLSLIDLSTNSILYFLDLARNNLTTLDLTMNPAIGRLECYDNKLANLNITGNPGLTYLSIGDTHFHPNQNSIASLDLSQNNLLEYVDVSGNQLTSLDLGNKPQLTRIWASGNSISNLDIEGSNEIEVLDLTNSDLTNIDLSTKSKLFQLQLASNNLACIDLTATQLITHLYLKGNNLKGLNLTSLSVLTYCEIGDNDLSILDLKSGNNNSFSDTYSKMDAAGNPNLMCVQVDNETLANNGTFPYDKWILDSHVVFSETCDYTAQDVDMDGVLYVNDQCYCTPLSDVVNATGCSVEVLDIESISNGDWDDINTWDCGCLPSIYDNVTIKTGHRVILNNTMNAGYTMKLHVEKGAVFDASGMLQSKPLK